MVSMMRQFLLSRRCNALKISVVSLTFCPLHVGRPILTKQSKKLKILISGLRLKKKGTASMGRSRSGTKKIAKFIDENTN